MSCPTTLTYDAVGNVLTEQITGPNSPVRSAENRYEHPLNLRTQRRNQADGDRDWLETVTTYDNAGNATSVTDTNGNTTTQTFDQPRIPAAHQPFGESR